MTTLKDWPAKLAPGLLAALVVWAGVRANGAENFLILAGSVVAVVGLLWLGEILWKRLSPWRSLTPWRKAAKVALAPLWIACGAVSVFIFVVLAGYGCHYQT